MAGSLTVVIAEKVFVMVLPKGGSAFELRAAGIRHLGVGDRLRHARSTPPALIYRGQGA